MYIGFLKPQKQTKKVFGTSLAYFERFNAKGNYFSINHKVSGFQGKLTLLLLVRFFFSPKSMHYNMNKQFTSNRLTAKHTIFVIIYILISCCLISSQTINSMFLLY